MVFTNAQIKLYRSIKEEAVPMQWFGACGNGVSLYTTYNVNPLLL